MSQLKIAIGLDMQRQLRGADAGQASLALGGSDHEVSAMSSSSRLPHPFLWILLSLVHPPLPRQFSSLKPPLPGPQNYSFSRGMATSRGWVLGSGLEGGCPPKKREKGIFLKKWRTKKVTYLHLFF